MKLNIEMVDPVGQILMELQDHKIGQRTVAITYAYIIAQEKAADWGVINSAIERRWPSKSSLERVKALAWKWVDYWGGSGKLPEASA